MKMRWMEKMDIFINRTTNMPWTPIMERLWWPLLQDELNSNMIVEINTPYGKNLPLWRIFFQSRGLWLECLFAIKIIPIISPSVQERIIHWKTIPLKFEIFTSDATPLMNIKEVFAELKAHQGSAIKGSFWKGDQVKYTAFVNEFYYKDKAADWRDFVNVDDRTFAIYTSAKEQQRWKEFYSNPSFRISQRSIKRSIIRIPRKPYLPSAWGIEAINEDKTQSILEVTTSLRI